MARKAFWEIVKRTAEAAGLDKLAQTAHLQIPIRITRR